MLPEINTFFFVSLHYMYDNDSDLSEAQLT